MLYESYKITSCERHDLHLKQSIAAASAKNLNVCAVIVEFSRILITVPDISGLCRKSSTLNLESRNYH